MELSAAEISALNAARDVLDVIRERTRTDSHDATTTHEAFCLGRTAETAYRASDAIFETLNCIVSFDLAKLTDAQLHHRAA
jgi:hypothetical protein